MDAGGSPVVAATGTSTSGVRTPPIAIWCSSRTMTDLVAVLVQLDALGLGRGGAARGPAHEVVQPRLEHLVVRADVDRLRAPQQVAGARVARSAEHRAQHVPSEWAVPATSQVRTRSVSSCRAFE